MKLQCLLPLMLALAIQSFAETSWFQSTPAEESKDRRNQDQDFVMSSLIYKEIMTRKFENYILDESVRTPAVVLLFSDDVKDVLLEDSWSRLVEALQPLQGVRTAAVSAADEDTLIFKTCRASQALPCLVLAMDQHLYIYKESLTYTYKILDYIRMKLPHNLVETITETNVESFLGNFEDNKVKALIFEHWSNKNLLYLITAFRYRNRLAFGFVYMSSRTAEKVTQRFRVKRNMDTMVIFKENIAQPVASVTMPALPALTLHHHIEPNLFLTLPRISSQSVLEQVCPVSFGVEQQRRLCCVLVSCKPCAGECAEYARSTFRQLASAHDMQFKMLRYGYIYANDHAHFLKTLAAGSGDKNAAKYPSLMVNRIVVIWRHEKSKIRYEWLNVTWPVPKPVWNDGDPTLYQHLMRYQTSLNEATRELKLLIKRLLIHPETIPYEAHDVQELVDEEADASSGVVWRALMACAKSDWAARTAHDLAVVAIFAMAYTSIYYILCITLLMAYRMQ